MTISIVIPIYNSAAYLQRCVDSVLRQEYQDIELVLVDDGSDDESGAICDGYSARHSFIKVVHQPNSGRSMARWNGVKMATGEWLMFVDSDDMLPSNSCSLLADKISEMVDIILGCGYNLHVEHNDRICLAEFRHLAVRAEGYIGQPVGSLYRRSFLRQEFFDVDRDIYMGEDYIFWLRMAFTTENPIAVVDAETYCTLESHTCKKFVWTADYAQRVDNLRVAAIPIEVRENYIKDIIHDRIVNMMAVALLQKKKHWIRHTFYTNLLLDIRRYGYPLPYKQRLYFALPSLWLRHLYSTISNFIRKK